MSVSCDNYLGDGKFPLSRRDSVGSGSPHSSKVKALSIHYYTSCTVNRLALCNRLRSFEVWNQVIKFDAVQLNLPQAWNLCCKECQIDKLDKQQILFLNYS